MDTDTEYSHFPTVSGDKDSKYLLQNDAKRELEKEIIPNTPSRLEGKTRILRASDVLLSLAGRPTTIDPREPSPAVENFAEALRLFPPFRDDDAATLGVPEVKCPDCDAVFSSATELNQHYLSRYCSGSAIAVYVMTRDRLITKGYRMEKRLIPLDCRPIRFFCNRCERSFAVDDEPAERQRNTECLVDCTRCGSKCNVLYEPVLNDPRDDTSYRDLQKEIGNATHSRSPSLAQKGSLPSKYSMADFNGEQTLAKKARRLRDSWSFRKLSQSDEEEVLAISFAGLYDLERVHAPNGIYQPVPAGTGTDSGPGTMPSDASFCSTGLGDSTIIEPGNTGLCQDEGKHQASDLDSPGGALSDSRNVIHETPRASKRQSFFQKIFGRKIPMGGISRSRSINKGKKLMKRANTIRFSFVTKNPGRDSRTAARDSGGTSEEVLARAPDDSHDNSSTTVQDAEYVGLMRGAQNVFVHMQYISGGAIVHDVSGRQRILQVDEVARVFVQMKDELSSTAAWSRALTTRLRGEALMKQGNAQQAVVELHDAMKVLDDTPGLDIEKQTRAAILHSMGLAYRCLDIPAEAEACYLEALGLYKRVLGRDHPKNFAILHDLGGLCEKDGYATEAAALYERSFAGRLKTLGNNAPETLSSMQDLASLKVLLGDLESALLLLEKAVPALDTVFGIQHATTLNAMNKLSLLYTKLGLEKEARMICGRTIPHCRTVFGLSNPVTRDTVVRYLQSTENFDFSPDINDILHSYKLSRDGDCLRVIHRLGRSYMDAGLNRDAAALFEALVEDFLAVKGPEAPETFDALSALCVSREHLDAVDKAMLAYRQLVHMAKRTPEHHHSRKRIGYAEKRISELSRRRESLESEKKEWGLSEPKPCENCGSLTIVLCKICKIARLCSDTCRKQSNAWHDAQCIPSVSLRESKSLAVKPKCPISARDQALSKIGHADINIKNVNIIASYTFYLDPRNFTTFRMKLNPKVNTVILFSLDSDIQYTVLNNNPPQSQTSSPVAEQAKGSRLSLTSSKKNNTQAATAPPPVPPSQSDSGSAETQELTWLTPQSQDSISYTPITSATPTPASPLNPNLPPSIKTNQNQSKYVLVRPGKEMHNSLVDKRISVRAGSEGAERDLFVATTQPNKELIEYAQGLLLTGYLGEGFMYVVEWVWR